MFLFSHFRLYRIFPYAGNFRVKARSSLTGIWRPPLRRTNHLESVLQVKQHQVLHSKEKVKEKKQSG